MGRSFTANSGTKAAVLPKNSSSTANSGTVVAVLLGMNRCSSFPLLSAPHSLFSIWTELKISKKIPGAPTWGWGEWIWLTGPSIARGNSPQRLNISSISGFERPLSSKQNWTLFHDPSGHLRRLFSSYDSNCILTKPIYSPCQFELITADITEILSKLICQSRCTIFSPIFPSLHLRHNSFSNP